MTQEFNEKQYEIEKQEEESAKNDVSFTEIKNVASKNISQMLQDLSDFEEAIKMENIPDIYRIYNGKLHREIKETSNQNHEIDDLLARKIHDSFVESFPFMKLIQRVSPTVQHYKIGDYYRERTTIGIDASVPAIFVIPNVDKEWEIFQEDNTNLLQEAQEQIDQLDAKRIAAGTEIQKLQEKIESIKVKEEELSGTKNFFNRGKIEEELESLKQERLPFEKKKAEWQKISDDDEYNEQQKKQLKDRYQLLRLNHAIVEKEMRQINRYFGSFEQFGEKIESFLTNYANPKEVSTDE